MKKISTRAATGNQWAKLTRHIELTHYCRSVLIQHFKDRPNVYAAGNNFIYFEQGVPSAVVSPDCYVVFGIPMRLRNSYMTWKEGGHLPSFVLEITSKKTRRDDVRKKRALYENVLRVPEYFLFDPDGDYLKPRLQAYRMINGRYELLLPTDNRIYSEQLGLFLVMQDDQMYFYDPETDTKLLTYAELQARVEAESQARMKLEAELARAQAKLAELQKQMEEATSLRDAVDRKRNEDNL